MKQIIQKIKKRLLTRRYEKKLKQAVDAYFNASDLQELRFCKVKKFAKKRK